jgi:hypothetical protein
MVALAGPIAERRSPIRHRYVRHEDDIENARNAVICAALLAAGKPVPESPTNMILDVHDPIVQDGERRYVRLSSATKKMVAARWKAVERVAIALQSRDRLDQTELDALISAID